jgi:DNA invertase Pin-like site-specific DNA recombinase
MARTSRTETQTVQTTFQNVLTAFRIWRVAIYIRLSREDIKAKEEAKAKGRVFDESDSVSNQRDIDREYIAKLNANSQGDQYIIVDEYIDDGISGTTEDEREEFQRMLGDVQSGRVNCVIVKTLARAFRNYSDQGYFLENFFPRHNVRFISIGDPHVDTYENPEVINGIEVPFSGLMNDRYAARTSNDIRRTFNSKRSRGEFIGSFAPYGYMKDPEDKNALIVDPEAAETVKQIFTLFLGGTQKVQIARHLNEHGVLSPAAYKKSKGAKYTPPNATDLLLWSAMSINNVLQNRVYCGDMVQGRHRVKSYKIHVLEKVPEDEWFIKENTHEAIIDRETFDKVQGLMRRDTRTSPKKKELYLFSGFLKCADCGRAMSRAGRKDLYVYYQCATYKTHSKTACTMHSIKGNKLEAAVLYAIQQQYFVAVSYAETVSRINASPLKKSQSARLAETIAVKEKELAKIKRYKQGLYEDWKDGNITHDDFRHMTEDYERQAAAVQSGFRHFENGTDGA